MPMVVHQRPMASSQTSSELIHVKLKEASIPLSHIQRLSKKKSFNENTPRKCYISFELILIDMEATVIFFSECYIIYARFILYYL